MQGQIAPSDPGSDVSITGPPSAVELTAAELGLASEVPGSGSISSGVVPTYGAPRLAVAAALSEAGSVSIQRYLDKSGTIATGPPLNAALSANAIAIVDNNDGTSFQSVVVEISNTTSTAAELSAFMLVLFGR